MRGFVTSDGRTIFLKEHILITMQIVFNAPMRTVERQYFWGGLIKAGDKIGGLSRFFSGFPLLSGSGDGAHGTKSRPYFFECIRGRNQGDVPSLVASMSVVFGGVFLPV